MVAADEVRHWNALQTEVRGFVHNEFLTEHAVEGISAALLVEVAAMHAAHKAALARAVAAVNAERDEVWVNSCVHPGLS